MTSSTAKPSVLFVCVHNGGRCQMAAGLLTTLSARSAGSLPAVQINPVAVAAIAEVSIDITSQTPRVLTIRDAIRARVAALLATLGVELVG